MMGPEKINRALSLKWQIEEDVYYPKMLQIEDLVKKRKYVAQKMCQFPLILHLYFNNLK